MQTINEILLMINIIIGASKALITVFVSEIRGVELCLD